MHELALYFSQPLKQVEELPLSQANDFFNGDPFSDWKKARDSAVKIQIAIIDRLDGLAKMLAKR